MKKMICPNWLRCRVEEQDCVHAHVHSFIEDISILNRSGSRGGFKGCDKVSTLDDGVGKGCFAGKGCSADRPLGCIIYPCLRVTCGGCIGAEEDDLPEVDPVRQ